MTKPTPIFVNARFLCEPVTGIQRWARETLAALDQLIEDGKIDKDKYCFTLLSPTMPSDMPDYKHLQLKVKGVLRSHFWEQFELPLYARGYLLNFKNTAPIFKRNQSMQIHDLQTFANSETHSSIFNLLYRIVVPRAARKSKLLTCPSEYTATEIEKYLGVSRDKCLVTEEGHEHVLAFGQDESILKSHNIEKGQFLLAVSSLNPNKNFAAILRAMAIAKVPNKLVIAGGTNPKIFKGDGVESLPDNVVYVGRVSDEQLRSLYENALGFLYPSFYEGWGLPPGEAMQLGCPVISSNTSSLPQVCGDAALYCDPHDDASIAEQISKLCTTPELRDELIAAGHAQASKFSWAKVADKIWASIEKACNE
jgi:glycosyltransferase involved in cell wall biosynthesis